MQRDRARAKPLHGKAEVRQPFVIGQRFTHNAQRPRVKLIKCATMRGRHRIAQPACITQLARQVPAFSIDIAILMRNVRTGGHVQAAPCGKLLAKQDVLAGEKGRERCDYSH